MSGSLKASLIAIVLYASSTLAIAQSVFENESPFREAEGFGTPATCQTIDDWINRVPDYVGRITMVIKGTIGESHRDGTLAYLIMCRQEGIQVMCVTYAEREASPQLVLFAGGYSRTADRARSLPGIPVGLIDVFGRPDVRIERGCCCWS